MGAPSGRRDNTTVQTLAYTYDASGNRTGLTATGTESYAVEYTYDENNRLTDEDKLIGGVVSDYVLYFYDDNGNLLSRLDTASGWDTYSYNNLNQLIAATAGGMMATYTYDTHGIRTGKCVEDTNTTFLLDGSNVAAEVENNAVSANYLWGANPIRADRASTVRYFLYNAHGDVVQLTDGTGTLQKSYAYDAFGNEKNPSSTDVNPFRYCGEYWDSETGTYYLRARYYDPVIGRFTQADTHWDVSNMIYGDNPQKINEREDALGLKTYTYVPEITAIMQAGNLYVYAGDNPISYIDPTGELSLSLVHNWVVDDIQEKYALAGMMKNKMIDYPGSRYGFADLINIITGEVWEVKKSTVSVTSALKQLGNYTSGQLHNKDLRKLAPQLYTGGTQGTVIATGSLIKTVGFDTYYVDYWDCKNGIIQYSYYRVTNWQQVGEVASGIVIIGGIAFLIYITGGAAAPILVPA